MAYIEPDAIAGAKRVDLLSYLKKNNPGDLVRDGDGYRLRSHDSLKISNGMWHWFSRGIGGRTALDYLIHVEGMPFTDAVLAVGANGAARTGTDAPAKRKRTRTLLMPHRHSDNDTLLHYLENARSICRRVASDFVRRGLAYESHFTNAEGRTYRNAVFVGMDKGGVPRQASIRGMFSGYKSEAAGSDKRYSLTLPPEIGEGVRLRVFEGAIDMMSYLTLRMMHGMPENSDHLMSLSGVYRPGAKDGNPRLPLAVARYAEEHPEIKEAVLHLDNDLAGRIASDALAAALRAIGIDAVSRPPKTGKDYNDCLRLALARRERESLER